MKPAVAQGRESLRSGTCSGEVSVSSEGRISCSGLSRRPLGGGSDILFLKECREAPLRPNENGSVRRFASCSKF